MANLERIQTPTPRFNDNLLPSTYSVNVVSGNSDVEVTSNSYGFDENDSIYLRSITTNVVVFDLEDYSVTIPKDGIYAFSLRLFKINPLFEWQFFCKIFVNGLLYETFGNDIYSSSSGFEDGTWNTYGQSFAFTEGDVVTFRFEASTGSINNYLYISAPKFEYLDKDFTIPSIYSYPIDTKTELLERVIVNQSNVASTLGGEIDGLKEYFIDGIIDMTGVDVSVPIGGINLRGYNLKASKLVCADDNYTMFYSPVGGSGDVLFLDLAIEVTGLNSKVYNLKSATGFEAFESNRINYDNCVSLGVVDNYRQGLEFGNGRFGGTPTLELVGTWLGGYRITTSIVRGLEPTMNAPLFKAGTGFVMNSRFLTDMNTDLGATASLVDFSPVNFVKSNSFQIIDAEITRNGVYNPLDLNITPNISPSDLVCYWANNSGVLNTYVGASYKVTTEVPTVFGAINTYTDLLGTFTPDNLVHFDSPANGQLRNLSDVTIEYKCDSQFVIAGTANDNITLRILVYRDSTASFEEICTQTRVINNFTGGRDVAYFNLNCYFRLFQNDYVKIQAKNISGTTSATSELDSFLNIYKR